MPARVILTGSGNSRNGGLIAKTPNLTMVLLNGDYASTQSIYIQAKSGVTSNTSGRGIAMDIPLYMATIRDVSIDAPFIGVDVSGNSILIDHLVVNDLPTNGIGWKIGRLTINGATADLRITNSTVGGSSSGAAYDQIIYDAGGLYESNNDLLFASFGTFIYSGASQWVVWASFSNTVLGDTNGTAGLVIDTSASGARVAGLMCSSCWIGSAQSSASGSNIIINTSSSGIIDGIHFVGSRIFTSAKALAYLAAGTNISFDATQFCGAAPGQNNITLTSGVSGVAIRNNHIGGACDFNTTAGSTGLALLGLNSNITLVGNDFSGVGIPVSGSPIGDSTAEANSGMGPVPSVAIVSSTITLPGIFKNYTITAAGPVTTITGGWPNRSVTLVTAASVSLLAVTFATRIRVLLTHL